MPKPKLALYSKNLGQCSCYSRLSNDEFETETANTQRRFLRKIKEVDADLGLVCLCSALRKPERLLRAKIFAQPLPILAYFESANHDLIELATQRGAQDFLFANMEMGEIRQIISKTIRTGGLRRFLEFC